MMCLGNNISPSIGTPLLTKKKLLADSLMRKLEKKIFCFKAMLMLALKSLKEELISILVGYGWER